MGRPKRPYWQLAQKNKHITEEQLEEVRRLYVSGTYTLQALAGMYHTKEHLLRKALKGE